MDLLRDVLLNFWVKRVLEDLDAEQVWSLLVARVDQPLELRVLVQDQCNPIEAQQQLLTSSASLQGGTLTWTAAS